MSKTAHRWSAAVESSESEVGDDAIGMAGRHGVRDFASEVYLTEVGIDKGLVSVLERVGVCVGLERLELSFDIGLYELVVLVHVPSS